VKCKTPQKTLTKLEVKVFLTWRKRRFATGLLHTSLPPKGAARRWLKGLTPSPLAITILMFIFFIFHQYWSRDGVHCRIPFGSTTRRRNTFIIKPGDYEFSRFEKYWSSFLHSCVVCTTSQWRIYAWAMTYGPRDFGVLWRSFLSRLSVNWTFAKLRRGITSQFTLKRAEMQMSTPDCYQYSNNTSKLCIWAWERFRSSVWKQSQKNEKETTGT